MEMKGLFCHLSDQLFLVNADNLICFFYIQIQRIMGKK